MSEIENDSVVSGVTPGAAMLSAASPAAVPAAQVVYTQTRSVELDPALLAQSRILNQHSPAEMITAFKLLRTQVLQRLAANGWNSVGVVSAGFGEGKTLTAINLAISIARDYKHTSLLADFDLSDPSIHRYLGFEPQYGLDDYLQRRCTLADALVNPGSERMVLLPSKQPSVEASEILASPAVESLADELRGRYADRVIVFDLPPLLGVDEALAFSPYVDALLVVVEERGTTREQLQLLAHMIGDKPVLGTVLNKARHG